MNETAFWAKVDRAGSDECWAWRGFRNHEGYGRIFLSTDPDGIHRRSWLAHRLVWRLLHGPIPAGRLVCHACDDRACCNPAHLWLGTDADNARDRDAKGRGAMGTRCGAAKLTPALIVDARRAHEQGESLRSIGRRLGVHHGTIANAIRGVYWKRPDPCVA